MKKIILSALAAILITSSAHAAIHSIANTSGVNNQQKGGQIGVGLAVGTLIGLSGQYWLDNHTALNGALAVEHGNFVMSAAHLWLFRGAFGNASRAATYFVPYVGAGAITAFGSSSDYFSRHGNSFAFAAQAPLGMEFLPSDQRFDIFAEIAPSLEITPVVDTFFTGLVGARFYF